MPPGPGENDTGKATAIEMEDDLLITKLLMQPSGVTASGISSNQIDDGLLDRLHQSLKSV